MKATITEGKTIITYADPPESFLKDGAVCPQCKSPIVRPPMPEQVGTAGNIDPLVFIEWTNSRKCTACDWKS